MGNKEEKNYYEILEISPHASEEEIHRSYIQAKNTYVQDNLALYSLLTKEECEKVLERIEEAYTILSDPEKRIQYNMARGIEAPESEFSEINSNKSEEPKWEKRGLPAKPEIKRETEETQQSEGEDSEGGGAVGVMSKIVANKRFTLEYNFNLEVEKRIERAENFSGKFLKEIREYKNVDLPRMSDMTKISKTYLRNIENENWKNLPAKAYIRGFVYQYAKCLKLNPDLVATSYINRMNRNES